MKWIICWIRGCNFGEYESPYEICPRCDHQWGGSPYYANLWWRMRHNLLWLWRRNRFWSRCEVCGKWMWFNVDYTCSKSCDAKWVPF